MHEPGSIESQNILVRVAGKVARRIKPLAVDEAVLRDTSPDDDQKERTWSKYPTIMWIGLMTFIVIVLVTALQRKRLPAGVTIEVPIAESLHDPQDTPAWLDRWRPWLIASVVIILLSYGPQLYEQITQVQLTSPGFTP